MLYPPQPPKGGLLCFPFLFKCQWLRPVGACPRPLKIKKNPLPVISILYYIAYQLFFSFYNSLKINVL